MIEMTRDEAAVSVCRVRTSTTANLFLLREPVAHWLIISVTRDSTQIRTVKRNKKHKHQINYFHGIVHV